jgi:aerobic carbon-monoxide dehydrogenase medium subunit
MKPAPFEYADPRTVDEAVALLGTHGDDAKVLAGGQSLVPMLALRLARPSVVIDVNRVAGLDGITQNGAQIAVGALVRQRALERWAAERAPLLTTALGHVGHAPIRTRGTVAGSIAHADPASELPALLLCLDGAVVARSGRGTRTIAAAEFFQGPLMTALAADELVTETRWTLPAAHTGWGFREMARRHGDFALVGVAVVLTLARGAVADARIALFGAAATPVRAGAAEQALRGHPPSDSALAEAARLATTGLETVSDIHAPAAYRASVTRTLTGRALADAAARAKDAA